jgi:hypothetical protein
MEDDGEGMIADMRAMTIDLFCSTRLDNDTSIEPTMVQRGAEI